MSDDLRRLKEDLVAHAKRLANLALAPNTLLLSFGGPVSVMPFVPSGLVAFGMRMLEVMGDCPGVIWGQYGCLTVGNDLDEALRRTVVLEGGAKIAYLAQQPGSLAMLTPDDYPNLKA